MEDQAFITARLLNVLRDPNSTPEDPLFQGIVQITATGWHEDDDLVALQLDQFVIAEVQGDATLDALLSDKGIYSGVPGDADYPHIVIADSTEDEGIHALGENDHENTVELKIWSDVRGHEEVKRIWGHLKRLLHGRSVQL